MAQIADQIHWLIVSKQIIPGEKLPPVREMADHLRINLHTVRAAYQRLEESKLIHTRRGLGSVVQNYNSSDTISANSGRTHTIGAIVPDLENPFYPSFLSGAVRITQQQHVQLITCDTQSSYSLGKALFDMLIAKRVDGMLIAPWGLGPGPGEFAREEYYDYPIPLVFVDQPDIEGYSVLLDSISAGYQAAEHLISHGHKKIAMITGSLNAPTLNQVFNGYRVALDDHGLDFHPQIVIEADGFSYWEGYQITMALIEDKQLPTALFAAGDMYAVGAMKALREKGIRVPDDVAIVGYNNIDVANYTFPTLTSVSTPTQEVGVRSAELLLKLINGEKVVDRKIILPSQLIVRESCGCNK